MPALAYSELTVYQKGAWHMLDEASTIELFDGVRQDFENLALASFFAELTESVAEEGSPAPELLRLLLNALYALGVLHKEPLLVKTAFTLRLLALAGFEPLADGCAVCGRRSRKSRCSTSCTASSTAPPASSRAACRCR